VGTVGGWEEEEGEEDDEGDVKMEVAEGDTGHDGDGVLIPSSILLVGVFCG